jgi:uncharacterized protein with PIN domain
MRIFGYDTVYSRDDKREEVVITCLREKRVLLTRCSDLEKHAGIRKVLVASDGLQAQLRQVFNELGIRVHEKDIFTRCVECNEPLSETDKKFIRGLVPEYVLATKENFRRCPSCGKIFWKGTHYELVRDFLRRKIYVSGNA